MIVSLIVAMGQNNEIGKDNNLLWRKLSDDMSFFKESTLNHHIITGRKNYESIPEKFRPLPKRTNIVVTKDKNYIANGCHIFDSLEKSINFSKENRQDKVFIIGGGQIYQSAIEKNLVDEMFITHVNSKFDDAQIFFPKFDENLWEKNCIKSVKKNENNEFDFDIYHYKKKS